ncbi:MAG: hypothetical protein P4L55_06430 [Syntrophobacteraceae bacterium]|nr:hypothetical protein [Syntrophobacteraceae bacterium]
MIGIISKDHQDWAVREFFELFKTPWEFYDSSRHYDVVIITKPDAELPDANLTLFFGEANGHLSARDPSPGETLVLHAGQTEFPIYTGCVCFPAGNRGLIEIKGSDLPACQEKHKQGRRVLRVGYDIFDELEFILCHGQPVEFACLPTIDIHISLLRHWIIESGIILVEVPPVPYGFAFTTCLTHDVDFLEIKDHLLDRSLLGFIFRALFPVGLKGLGPKRALRRQIRNWKALASLPAVFAGWTKDPWLDVERYMSLESGTPATYFFIPFKGHPGSSDSIQPPHYRAAKYDINRHKDLIASVLKAGNEIGLHGIDAWLNCREATKERDVIEGIAGRDCGGVRMHWLYFSDKSPVSLQDAGLKYDSSSGFNETVGFKSGTTQVFCHHQTKLFELPLNIMDTALFSRGRLAVSEKKARDLCQCVINQALAYGGAITVNWHTRSLSPERNWDQFYSNLLQSIKELKPWFASAQQAVDWFSERRALKFRQIESKGKPGISLSSLPEQNNLPSPVMRIHHPNPQGNPIAIARTDQPLRGLKNYEVAL